MRVNVQRMSTGIIEPIADNTKVSKVGRILIWNTAVTLNRKRII